MLRVDLIRLEDEKDQMRFAETKLECLTGEFDSTMRALERMLNIEELEQSRYSVHRRLEEHQDGIRQLGNAVVRARQLYQQREQQITDNCEEGNLMIVKPILPFMPFPPLPPRPPFPPFLIFPPFQRGRGLVPLPEWLKRIFVDLRLEDVFGEED